MSEKKEKKERLMTPVGEAKWAHVHTPYAYKNPTTGVEGGPKYQIDVLFDGNDPEWKSWAAKLMDKFRAIPPMIRKSTGEPLPTFPPIKKELNESEEPTGRFFATFKTGAQYRPGVFDRFGSIVPENVLIGNGSKVRVSYTESVFESPAIGTGITLYLSAVQITELVPYGMRSAESYGFPLDDAPQDSPSEESPAFKEDLPF